MKVSVSDVRLVSMQVLTASGVPEPHARIITDTIVYAHERGKHTHGLGRLGIYLRKIESGLMDPETPLEVLHDHGAVYHIDAHHGFGQVAAFHGMEAAIERAREFGIGMTSVKDSNNFGTAGFFAKQAADKGAIGLVCANAAPAIAPAVGGTALFGTNPLSMAFPAGDPDDPVIFDMAVSQAARGKVRLAAKKGEPIPEGWALDENGRPTTDASEALKGSMLPVGGVKGSGLAMMVDVLAGLLSGSAFAGGVKNLGHATDRSRNGHALIAIDIAAFMDRGAFIEKADYLKAMTHEHGGVMPGETSFAISQRNPGEVDLPEVQIEEVNGIAADLGLKCRLASSSRMP